MKKIYITLLGLVSAMTVQAQLTLTKAANSPVVGDAFMLKQYDSSGVVPKATGTNQNWNFSNLTTTQSAMPHTYTNVSAYPAASLFPGADIVFQKGGTEVEFQKVGGANFEFVGFYDTNGPSFLSFTNTAIMVSWPVSYNSTFSDNAVGAMTSGTNVMVASGVISYTATGTGSVVLPGPKTHSNCLQVIQQVSLSMTSGTNVTVFTQKRYSYYSSLMKFPIIEYQYEAQTSGTVVTNGFFMNITQEALNVGVEELNLSENTVGFYPNPATDILMITGTSGVFETNIYDLTGRLVSRSVNENRIDVSKLPASVYMIRIKTERGSTVKRLVVRD